MDALAAWLLSGVCYIQFQPQANDLLSIHSGSHWGLVWPVAVHRAQWTLVSPGWWQEQVFMSPRCLQLQPVPTLGPLWPALPCPVVSGRTQQRQHSSQAMGDSGWSGGQPSPAATAAEAGPSLAQACKLCGAWPGLAQLHGGTRPAPYLY